MKLSKFVKVCNEFGAYAVESAQLELGTTRTIRGRKVRRVFTGNLQSSLYHRTYIRSKGKGTTRVVFGAKGSAGNYASFVEYGVNGTKTNVGSPFSFKGKFVNIGAIEKMVRNNKFRIRRKGKFVAKTESNIRGTAFVIARSIAEKGIVGVPYMRKGIERAYKKYESKLSNALIEDTIKYIDNGSNNN